MKMPPVVPSYEWMNNKSEPVALELNPNQSWKESFQKLKDAAEELRAIFGQMADEMKKLREESEVLELEVAEEPIVPSQPGFLKARVENPDGCFEIANSSQEITDEAPFSDSEQEIDSCVDRVESLQINTEQWIEELNGETGDMGISRDLSLGSRSVNLKLETNFNLEVDQGRCWQGVLQSLPNDFNHRSIANNGYITETDFSRGNPNCFDEIKIEHLKFRSELIDKYLRVEFERTAMSFLVIPYAQQLFDVMFTRGFHASGHMIRLENACLLMGSPDLIFDPGGTKQLKSLNLQGCCVKDGLRVEFKGDLFTLYATGLTLILSRGYDFVELLSMFGDFFKSIDRTSSFTFDPGGVFGMLIAGLALDFRGCTTTIEAGIVEQRLQWDPGGIAIW